MQYTGNGSQSCKLSNADKRVTYALQPWILSIACCWAMSLQKAMKTQLHIIRKAYKYYYSLVCCTRFCSYHWIATARLAASGNAQQERRLAQNATPSTVQNPVSSNHIYRSQIACLGNQQAISWCSCDVVRIYLGNVHGDTAYVAASHMSKNKHHSPLMCAP